LQTQEGHDPKPYISFLVKSKVQLGSMLNDNLQTYLGIKTSKSLQGEWH